MKKVLVKIKTYTVKPFDSSSLNDRDSFDFGRGDWTKGFSVLGILIYLLLFFIKFEKNLVKNMFLYRKHIKNYELWTIKYRI